MKKLPNKQKNEKLDKIEKKHERELAEIYKTARENTKNKIAELEQKDVLKYKEMLQMQRLRKLKKEIEKELKEVITETNDVLTLEQLQLYDLAFKETMKEINLSANVVLPKKQIEEGIQNKLDKVGFIKRNTRNTEEVIKTTNRMITLGLIQGKAYKDIANIIDERFNVGFNNALRIARTEGHRVREQGTIDSLKEAEKQGVKLKKQWLTAQDERVRSEHAELDGQIIDMDEEFKVSGYSADIPGNFGAPEMDINCRCTIIAIIQN